MPLLAILLDLDDTLVVDEAVSREAFAATAEHAFKTLGIDRALFEDSAQRHARRLWAESPVNTYCRRLGISAFECLWGRFEGAQDDLTALREWAHRYRRQVFDAALRDQGITDVEAHEDLVDAFARHRRRLQRLMPNAVEVLARLKLKYKLGLLTNGAPDLQREKLAASGLEGLFDAVAISGEHDVGKPNAEIFHRLLGELGASPQTSVMVGNSLERDVQGARNAGILSVWLEVPGCEEHADVRPDFTIRGLADLPALLEQIDAKVPAAHCV